MMFPESDFILNADGSIYHLGLRPGEVSDLILTVGDPERVAKVSRFFDEIELKRQCREFITHTGRIGKLRISVVSSGIGTDNVEILMTEVDALFNIDFSTRTPKHEHTSLRFIRLGTSGSFIHDISVDSIVFSETATGLDSLMQFYLLPQNPLEIERCEVLKNRLELGFLPYSVSGSERLLGLFPEGHRAHTITCPGFYAPQGRVLRLRPQIEGLLSKLLILSQTEFSFGNFEMETSGYYAFARLLGHEFLSVNAIMADRLRGRFSKTPDTTVDGMIEHVLTTLTERGLA